MQCLLLFESDHRPFEIDAIQRIFQTVPGFHDMRFDEPGGAALEAEFVAGPESTIVDLSGDCQTLSVSGTTDAALQAVLILQQHIDSPLRIIDLDYSFDFALRDFATIGALRAAIDNAQTD